jgi:hypothetical protein
MKKLVLTFAISVFATTAYAGPGKVSVLHCGVKAGDADMTYKAISISKKSKGHGRKHIVGSVSSVGTGVIDEETQEEIQIEFVRAGADCLLSGVPGDASIGAVCDETTQYAGAVCGTQVL